MSKMTFGMSLLGIAAMSNQEEVVQTLLEKDIDTPHTKESVLMVAAGLGHSRIVQAFLSNRVNVNARTDSGITP